MAIPTTRTKENAQIYIDQDLLIPGNCNKMTGYLEKDHESGKIIKGY